MFTVSAIWMMCTPTHCTLIYGKYLGDTMGRSQGADVTPGGKEGELVVVHDCIPPASQAISQAPVPQTTEEHINWRFAGVYGGSRKQIMRSSKRSISPFLKEKQTPDPCQTFRSGMVLRNVDRGRRYRNNLTYKV